MPGKGQVDIMPDARPSKTPFKPKRTPSSSAWTLDLLQIVSSLLFRTATFIFLRWIPTSLAWPFIPAVYAVYLSTWLIKDVRVRRTLRHWSTADAARNLKELAKEVTVDDKKIGKQVGNSHQAQDVPVVTDSAIAGSSGRSSPALSAFGLLWGLSVHNRFVNLVSLALHTLALLFFLDSYASPYLVPSFYDSNLVFHRVADVGPNHAKVHVRWPEPVPLFEGLEETFEGSGVLRDGMQRAEKPFRLVYREISSVIATFPSTGGSNRWERGPLFDLAAENDWTSVAYLANLWPSTQYEYRLAWAHNNTFVSPHRLIDFETSSLTSSLLGPSESILEGSDRNFVGGKFRTWPDPRAGSGLGSLIVAPIIDEEDDYGELVPIDDPHHFKFLTSSCVKADFPWSPSQFVAWSWVLQLLPNLPSLLPESLRGPRKEIQLTQETDTWAKRNTIKGFDLMYEKYIRGRKEPNVRFFLQLGDLIYADVPRFGGAVLSSYRKLYRNLFASSSFRRVFEAIHMIGIYDDHEVKNNWSGLTSEGEVVKEFPSGNSAWREYVGSGNPDPLAPGENYYTFRYGSDTAFFVMDTRRFRVPSAGFPVDGEEGDITEEEYEASGEQPHKTMLGQEQKDALIRWLSSVNSTATFKFVVSSVPFMSLWGGSLDVDGKKDSWAAYLAEREELLEVMQYVPNVVVLSGDRHEFAATELRALSSTDPDQYPIKEFSTSPLNMFYLPVRTLSQEHGRGPTGQERLIKYVPDGNHKWSEIEVNTKSATSPYLILRLWVDGDLAWKVKYEGKPVKKETKTVGGIAQSFLELLGFKSRKWF